MQEPIIFVNKDDHWGYQSINKGTCYLIAARDDNETLIGDKLPETKAAAIQYCRVANAAHRNAIRIVKAEMLRTLDRVG